VRWMLIALPALMCGAMILLICVPMLLGRKHRRDEQSASKEEAAALREDVGRPPRRACPSFTS
jgi:hypothetical protein